MWIRDVEFPDALIEAHRSGDLVIFVGAGASMAPPSGLPDFKTMVADIAGGSGVSASEEQLNRPDVLLGELELHQHVDVHLRVANRIKVASSVPNALHKAIAALASAGPAVRIVTTNYDLHLSTVLGDEVPEYWAPALPMGDDFEGLVYLHGCLRQDPRWLVVTDEDFGRAYLRDAWAARFLERMFSTYTVVFVGYSHRDMVMSYLGRSLRLTNERFALTHEPEKSNWRALRIVPVAYPVKDESHSALEEAITAWTRLRTMGLLDHRQRVAELVSGVPSQVPEEAAYLEQVLAADDKVSFFTEHARSQAWLRWASEQPAFRELFGPDTASTNCTLALAHWFAEQYVMDENLTEDALSVVQEAGGRLGPALWSAIGWHLTQRSAPRPPWLGPWIVLLARDKPQLSSDWLEDLLVKSQWPDDREAALLLFERLTEPVVMFEPSYGLGDRPRLKVHLAGRPQLLGQAWERLFVPHLPDAAPEVLVIVDAHLRRAHRLLTAVYRTSSTWDRASSAIERHARDTVGSIDILVDAARDCLEVVLAGGSALGPAYLDAWATSPLTLLRRLAVHGWTKRQDVGPTAKLAWLRDRGWLFAYPLRQEVFRLIETTLADADADVADGLVADAAEGPGDVDVEHREYETYDALLWMSRFAPDLQSARDALTRAMARRPGFQERPYPARPWRWVERTPSPPPLTADALHDLISNDAGAAVAMLQPDQDAGSLPDGPTWDQTVGTLVDAVSRNPGDGFRILDADGGEDTDILRTVIAGWAAATVDDETATSIMLRLQEANLPPVAHDLARLLAGESRSAEWHRSPEARHLASRVWAAIDVSQFDVDDDHWLARALSHPAGQLAHFWLNAVAADWRQAGDSWTGMSPETRTHLDGLLTGGDERTTMAEIIFAAQVLFFHLADRHWSEARVLPLLDWADPVRARRTWDGFLMRGRWNDPLLAAGLLEHYLDAAAHVGDFRDEHRRHLHRHLANLAIHSELDLSADGWFRRLTTTGDLALRTGWMQQVAWLLSNLPEEAIEHQWQRWMRRYWEDRLASIPTQMTPEESSAMAGWVVYLGDSVAEGVSLATSHPGSLTEQSDLLHDLSRERVARAPAAMARLLAHLLRNTQAPFHGGYFLKVIVGVLREQPATVNVDEIVEQALRLGCGDAPTW